MFFADLISFVILYLTVDEVDSCYCIKIIYSQSNDLQKYFEFLFFWVLRRHLEDIVELLINCLSRNSTSSVDASSAFIQIRELIFCWKNKFYTSEQFKSFICEQIKKFVRRLLHQKESFVRFRSTFQIKKGIIYFYFI